MKGSKGPAKKAVKAAEKKVEKKVEKQIVQAAASNVGRGLPSANHFERLSTGLNGHSRRRFRYRKANREMMDVVGQSLLAAPTLNSPSQGQVVLQLDLNPHLLGAAAVNIEAGLWELDEIVGFTAHIPAAAATSDPSVLVAYVDIDPVDSTPTGQPAIDNAMNHNGIMFATRNGGVLRVPRSKLRATGWKYIDQGDASTADRRQTRQGVFRLLVETGGSSATIPVWCTYHIRFKERALDIASGPVANNTMLAVTNTTTAQITTTNPLGFGTSGLAIASSSATHLSGRVTLFTDGVISGIILRQRDGFKQGQLLHITHTQAATDCKGTWSVADVAMTNVYQRVPTAATSIAQRVSEWLYRLDAPSAAATTYSGTLNEVSANGVVSAARAIASADQLGPASPGWIFVLAIDAVSTPTVASTCFAMLQDTGTTEDLDRFGPATLQYQAAVDWDGKTPWGTYYAEYTRKKTDETELLRARVQMLLAKSDHRGLSLDPDEEYVRPNIRDSVTAAERKELVTPQRKRW